MTINKLVPNKNLKTLTRRSVRVGGSYGQKSSSSPSSSSRSSSKTSTYRKTKTISRNNFKNYGLSSRTSYHDTPVHSYNYGLEDQDYYDYHSGGVDINPDVAIVVFAIYMVFAFILILYLTVWACLKDYMMSGSEDLELEECV